MRQDQEGGECSTNNQAGRDVNYITIVHGVTEERAREIAEAASRETVLREGRAVAEAVITERVNHLNGLIFERIREEDNALFNRFEDPRFLAALTSAQRGYAETGDGDLAEELASLVVGLASQPVRSRREIFLRQAIEVAKQLTTEHINALSVQTYLTNFKLGEPYFEPEWLIKSFDTLLSHYYGRIPTSQLDYQYMSSMGVWYPDQLSTFASGPFEVLSKRYENAMYPSLTTKEVQEFLSPDHPDHEEFTTLLSAHAATEGDVKEASDGTTMVTVSGARFRIAPEAFAKVMTDSRDLSQLSSAERSLRGLVLDRWVTTAMFKEKIAEMKPRLADFLELVHNTGLMNHHLLPVGLVLAQHEIRSRAPQLSAVIEDAIDKGTTGAAG